MIWIINNRVGRWVEGRITIKYQVGLVHDGRVGEEAKDAFPDANSGDGCFHCGEGKGKCGGDRSELLESELARELMYKLFAGNWLLSELVVIIGLASRRPFEYGIECIQLNVHFLEKFKKRQ